MPFLGCLTMPSIVSNVFGVFSDGNNSKLRIKLTNANFISTIANFMPIQLRGPKPNAR